MVYSSEIICIHECPRMFYCPEIPQNMQLFFGWEMDYVIANLPAIFVLCPDDGLSESSICGVMPRHALHYYRGLRRPL